MNLQESIRRILKEETEDGMRDILFDIFDESTKGAELYEYHDFLWMILPEKKEWVFYASKNGNLWYNYDFFKQSYKYVSLDVVDNHHYITEWVEDILKKGIKHTSMAAFFFFFPVEDILKKGIKHTYPELPLNDYTVEDILKTGKKG